MENKKFTSENSGGNMSFNKIRLLFVIMLIIPISGVLSQNYNDALRLSEPEILTSARALGMGNAFTSISNDFSASLFNPAGFALMKKSQFAAGLNYNSFKNDTRFFNNITNYSNTNTECNQIGFTFPLPTSRGSLVLAFGYNQFKDFNRALKFSGFNSGNNSMIQDLTYDNDDIAYELGLSYPVYDNNNKYLYDETRINGKLNQSGNFLQEGGLNSWMLSGAIEIQQNIFVGVTINVINGDFKRVRDYWEDDSKNNYPSSLLLDPNDASTADFESFYFQDIIRWDVSGWNGTIGLLAKMDNNINLGTTVKLPKVLKVKEIYSVDAYADFGTGKRYYLDPPIENRIEYEIKTPMEISVGASYSLGSLTISGDASFIDYTQAEFTEGFDSRSREDKNLDIKDNFKNVINLNAGIEYVLPFRGIVVRGGFMIMPSPFKGDESEYDKKFFTVGLGFKSSDKFFIDVGYAHGWWKDLGDNYGSNLSRTFHDIQRDNLMFGIRYFL
jgi:long-subunit fatty acid transport protein